MHIALDGYACLGSYGSGAKNLWKKISDQTELAVNSATDTSALNDFFQPRALRQMDHFSRMALLGCCQAWKNAGKPGLEHTGIILTTAFGPAAPTFSFLKSLLEYGESMASPLAFSHSVHNIPAASVALKLEIQGPCATLCQPAGAISAGLLLALGWLKEQRVEKVLLVAVDENTPELEEALLISESSGLNLQIPRTEACAAFLISAKASENCRGWIKHVSENQIEVPRMPAIPKNNNLFVSGGGSSLFSPSVRVWHGIKAYGNTPVAQALDLAASLASAQPAFCLAADALPLGGYLQTLFQITPGQDPTCA